LHASTNKGVPVALTGTHIFTADPEGILGVARILRSGGIAILPTDTVYGLSASIFHPEAVDRVFEAKRRPPDRRVPILLGTAADLPIIVSNVPHAAWTLIERFWPGPLTLVLPARSSVPGTITRGGRTVAVRVPAARSCLELLQVLGEPLVGTSANVSGSPAAVTAAEALAQLGGSVDAILQDDDAIDAGISSTVVQVTTGPVVIHRVGAVTPDAIRRVLGLSVEVAVAD
jgi:L-threonylcarbamoyladenylate synthase